MKRFFVIALITALAVPLWGQTPPPPVEKKAEPKKPEKAEQEPRPVEQELQKQQFDSGGYINFGTYDYIDGVANHVQGLTPSKYLFASGCNLRRAWLAA